MVVAPTPQPRTSDPLMRATLVFPDSHVTGAFGITAPFSSRTVAWNVMRSPTATLPWVGSTTTVTVGVLLSTSLTGTDCGELAAPAAEMVMRPVYVPGVRLSALTPTLKSAGPLPLVGVTMSQG